MNESAEGEDLSKSERRHKRKKNARIQQSNQSWKVVSDSIWMLPFPIFFLEKSIFVSATLGNLFSQVYGSWKSH